MFFATPHPELEVAGVEQEVTSQFKLIAGFCEEGFQG